MIELIDATKTFRVGQIETTALDGVNFKVLKGDFVAVMGESGCGKSTLLNILGMLDTLSDGNYALNGINLSKASETRLAKHRRESIGFIFQQYNLLQNYSLLKNVMLALKFTEKNKLTRRDKAMEALELVGMGHRANHLPKQVSGGQQQRAAIARAIVTNPKLILADEPTGNLDSVLGGEVMTLIEKMNDRGHTVIMVTHSNEDAKFAKRVVKLHDGRFI